MSGWDQGAQREQDIYSESRALGTSVCFSLGLKCEPVLNASCMIYTRRKHPINQNSTSIYVADCMHVSGRNSFGLRRLANYARSGAKKL